MAAQADPAILVQSPERFLTDLAATQAHSQEFHKWQDETLFALDPVMIADARAADLARRSGERQGDARLRLLPPVREFLRAAREVQLLVADRAAVIRSLIAHGIGGYAYVKMMRERTDWPVLVLRQPDATG
jgi:broad specificity phosphatase PhoE